MFLLVHLAPLARGRSRQSLVPCDIEPQLQRVNGIMFEEGLVELSAADGSATLSAQPAQAALHQGHKADATQGHMKD